MAFAPPEQVAIRRHAGYPAAGLAGSTDALAVRLAALSPDEETVVLDLYLPSLDAMERALAQAGDSLDTKQAAVWHRNPAELAERNALYTDQRLRLCAFLGIEPGPGVMLATPIATGTDGVAPWLPPAVFVV